MTKQIADSLNAMLAPKGVGVVIESSHLCLQARGAQKKDCVMSTSSFTGLFKTDQRTRSEFLELIR